MVVSGFRQRTANCCLTGDNSDRHEMISTLQATNYFDRPEMAGLFFAKLKCYHIPMNSFERPQGSNSEESAEKPKNPYLAMRDKYRERSTEMQNNVAEVQAARYETAVHQLLERSGDDMELVNALNGFIKELEIQAARGRNDEPLSKAQVEKITKFFQEKTTELSGVLSGVVRRDNEK